MFRPLLFEDIDDEKGVIFKSRGTHVEFLHLKLKD